MAKYMLVAAAAISFASVSAQAAETIDTPSSGTWTNRPTEAGVGASAQITSTEARSGTGSLEIKGDRTRFATGTIYPNAASTQIASLASVTGLTFDWRIAGDSVTTLNPDYTPALRLHIWDADASVSRQIIWEGAYNGVYGPQTVPDTWYSTTTADKFYVGTGNENAGKTIAEWASTYAAGSFVAGISVGNGSGASAAYHAFADNVTLSTTSGSTTFNFEPNAAAGAVPEPSTWAMMLVGFGAVGFSMRRRKPSSVRAMQVA